jgi:hypothetical protein
MDILDESFGEEKQTPELGELVDLTPQPIFRFPAGSVRNRAATTAILTSEPDKLVETYQRLMQEDSEGIEVTRKQAEESLNKHTKAKTMPHLIALLGDTSIPLEQKKRIMDLVRDNEFKEDPAVTLQTQALVADSKGEDLRGEAARVSTADWLGEMTKERESRQKLVNQFMAKLPDADIGTVGEMAAAEVAPFGRNKISADVAEKINEEAGVPTSFGKWVKNFLLPGSSDADLQKKLMSIPPQDRDAHTKLILSGIEKGAGVFHNDNHYARFSTAVNLLDSPNHSDGHIWMKNIMTVLDFMWVGSELRALNAGMNSGKMAADYAGRARKPGSANPGVSDAEYVEKAKWELVDPPYNHNQIPSNTKRLTGPEKVVDDVKRIELNSIVRREHPASPYSVVEQVNPSQARQFHEAIVTSTGDEVAEALTGVPRDQAIINNISPQVGTESGNVLNKVNQDVKDILNNTGATRYTAGEFEEAVANTQRDFRNATGLEINDAMTTFRVDGDHILVDAHYSTVGGSFTTPEAARAQAKYALSDYGLRDDEIVVMQRQGMDYVPAEDGGGIGDYIIKVKTNHPVSDTQVDMWDTLDVKKNFTDRISQLTSEKVGSLSGSLFDFGSMLHPTLTGSASIAADQAVNIETLLLRPIKALRTEISAYPANRVAKIEEYIKEANINGLKQDAFDLTARGFSPAEIKSLAKWKDIWDGHFYLENYDLVKTLNSQGYKLLENLNTKLFAKAIPKNQNIAKLYDPSTGKIVPSDVAFMDSLYNQGGSYATLRRPINVNGVDVEHVIVRNTPTEYLRGIRDTDQVLNYRDGYYTVNYKAPKFVDEISVVGGKEVRRTVAVAGNTADAEMFIASQQQASGLKHVMREDSRGFAKDGDGYWDVNEASGRIAQRIRGKPLTEAKSTNLLGSGSFVEHPMESAVRAAKSLAGRTISRPMLETAKKRFMEQYGDFLPTVQGMKQYPRNMSELVDHASHTSSRIADARTTYGYIEFMENGYMNSMDEIYKGGFNALADWLGKMHLSTAERGARAIGNVAPTHLAKKTVFQAYIAMSNPIRQWIVQSHQMGRMVAYNPQGFVNGGFADRVAGYLGAKSGLMQSSQASKDFVKFVDDSGMVAGVDRNSLVRGMKLEMADSSSGFKRGVGTAWSLPQTVGFDAGEKVNMLGHLASVHEKWTRMGANLADKTVRDLALTEARALSLDLNKAGELTYTQGSAAFVLQFLQMPQKAMLQPFNRKLAWPVKARLLGWDLIMFGAPVGFMSAVWTAAGEDGGDILPDDPEYREMFVDGMESYIINAAINEMFDEDGEKSQLDLSALSPNDTSGITRMFSAFMDDGYFGALAASPAGQIMAVDGVNGKRTGRIPQAMITLGRYFNALEEVEPETPTEIVDVFRDAAKITSGWTAAENALLMLETRKKQSATGVVIDSSVTLPEIGGAFIGFGTKSTKELYEIGRRQDKAVKKHEESVMRKYRDIVSYYHRALDVDKPDIQHIQRVSSMLMKTFTDPGDLALVRSQWGKDLVGSERALFEKMLKNSTMPTLTSMLDDIRRWPVDDKTKEQMMGRVNHAREMHKRNEGK